MSDAAVRADDLLERSVLGGVIDLDCVTAFADAIDEEDFADLNHGAIWSATLAAAKCGKVTTASVAKALRERKRLTTVGGREYIERLIPFAPTDQQQLAALVEELAGGALARRLSRATRTLAALTADTSVVPAELERRAIALVTDATRRGLRSRVYSLADALDESWSSVEAVARGESVRATFGLRDLDEMTVGMRAKQLIVVAGRPGSGKSSLGLAAAEATARLGKRVLFWSVEMGREEIARRLKCGMARVELSRFLRGGVSEQETAALFAATESLGRLPLSIDDRSVSIDDIVSGSQREHARDPLSLVVIDHLHHLQWHRGARDEMSALNHAVMGAANLAKDLGVPVLLLSQLNRKVEERQNKRPQLADLRGTGTVEQAAHVAIGLYRDEYYDAHSRDKGIAEAIVLKQRDGATGMVRVGFDAKFTRFHDLTDAPAPEWNGGYEDGDL